MENDNTNNYLQGNTGLLPPTTIIYTTITLLTIGSRRNTNYIEEGTSNLRISYRSVTSTVEAQVSGS